MINLLLYLLESSVILMLLYLLFAALLGKETFFNISRFFLLGIPLFSLLFPLLSFELYFSKLGVVKDLNSFRLSYYQMITGWDDLIIKSATPMEVSAISNFNLWTLLLWTIILVYAGGLVFQLVKTIVIYRRMKLLTAKSDSVMIDGLKVIP